MKLRHMIMCAVFLCKPQQSGQFGNKINFSNAFTPKNLYMSQKSSTFASYFCNALIGGGALRAMRTRVRDNK